MIKIFSVALMLVFFTACSTRDPVITANPDQANSTSGTAGSSPVTDGRVPKSTDTLSAPMPRDSTLRR